MLAPQILSNRVPVLNLLLVGLVVHVASSCGLTHFPVNCCLQFIHILCDRVRENLLLALRPDHLDIPRVPLQLTNLHRLVVLLDATPYLNSDVGPSLLLHTKLASSPTSRPPASP